ncbi:MucR family transcriptional regulator (plasmid) [Methylobacterium sp. NMS12]
MKEQLSGSAFDLTELAGDIVAAYVSNNSVPIPDLPNLIRSVHDAVRGLASGNAPSATTANADVEKPSAAQIRKSVRPDGIVSFIDGKTYKTLKRHLTSHGLDPRAYRDRYGLPADYPMVAPAYAEQRSALAKAIGLGQPGAMAERRPKGAAGLPDKDCSDGSQGWGRGRAVDVNPRRNPVICGDAARNFPGPRPANSPRAG